MRWDAHQHMYMIRASLCFDNLYSLLITQLSQYLSYISFRLYFGANTILFSITQGCMNTGTAKC